MYEMLIKHITIPINQTVDGIDFFFDIVLVMTLDKKKSCWEQESVGSSPVGWFFRPSFLGWTVTKKYPVWQRLIYSSYKYLSPYCQEGNLAFFLYQLTPIQVIKFPVEIKK